MTAAADYKLIELVTRDGPLAAREVRYLRKALGMNQQQLAARMGLHRTTVTRWETGAVPIGQAESLALRALAAMQTVAQQPSLATTIAARFAAPQAGPGA